MSLIYIWGNPAKLIDSEQSVQPVTVALKHPVRQVSSGKSHIVVLTVNNQLIGLGANANGQLGSQQQSNSIQTPIIPTIFTKNVIVSVSCGWNHTLVLDHLGSIYSCGQGSQGALGHGRGTNSEQFQKIKIQRDALKNDVKIVQISAGRDHSLAISDTKVYGWGSSKNHELGLVKQKNYYQPQQLYIFHSYMCYAGDQCSYFCTNDGVYATGSNTGGKFGLGHSNKVKIPKRINNFNHHIVRITDGGYLLLQTENHEFYICGSGSIGTFIYPTQIKHFKKDDWVYIGPNYGIIKNKHKFYTWNFENEPNPVPRNLLAQLQVQDISCGPQSITGFTNNSNALVYTNMSKQSQRKQFSSKNEMRKGSDDLHRFLKEPFYQNKRQKTEDLCFPHQYNFEQHKQPVNRETPHNLSIDVNTPVFMRTREQNRQLSEDQDPFVLSRQKSMITHLVLDEKEKNIEGENNEVSPKINNYMYHEQGYYKQRVEYLEEANKRKDEQLKVMREQFTNLLEIVESDMALRKIVEVSDPEYLKKRYKELGIKSDCQQSDRFSNHIGKLREILKQKISGC